MSDRVEELRANLPPGRPRVGVTWMGAAGGPFVVTAVLPGGPADGKLRVGDVLVAVAGEHVTDAIRLVKAIQAHDGKTLEVTVRRDGLEVTEPVHVSSY